LLVYEHLASLQDKDGYGGYHAQTCRQPTSANDTSHSADWGTGIAVSLLDMIALTSHAVFHQVYSLTSKSRMQSVTDVTSTAGALAVVDKMRE
jgi:hypothetical protein